MIEVNHCAILTPSLWRVLPVALVLQIGMPSLTTATLDKRCSHFNRYYAHRNCFSAFPLSFLDITPVLKQFFYSILSFTHSSSIPFSFAPPLMQSISPKETGSPTHLQQTLHNSISSSNSVFSLTDESSISTSLPPFLLFRGTSDPCFALFLFFSSTAGWSPQIRYFFTSGVCGTVFKQFAW